MVYPKTTKIAKSIGERLKETGKGILGAIGGAVSALLGRGSTSEGDATKATEFKPLPPQIMGEQCLHIYLAEYKTKLCSGDFTSIPSIAEEINHIFESLYCPVIIHRNSNTPMEKRLEGKFKEVITLVPFFTYWKLVN